MSILRWQQQHKDLTLTGHLVVLYSCSITLLYRLDATAMRGDAQRCYMSIASSSRRPIVSFPHPAWFKPFWPRAPVCPFSRRERKRHALNLTSGSNRHSPPWHLEDSPGTTVFYWPFSICNKEHEKIMVSPLSYERHLHDNERISAMSMADPGYHRDLGDGLILRWSSASDVEAIAQLESVVFRDHATDPPNIALARYICEMMSGEYPL